MPAITPAENVSDATRAFEARDAHVAPGPDREPTPAEVAAARRSAPLKETTIQCYREMLDRGAWQQGEGRPGW